LNRNKLIIIIAASVLSVALTVIGAIHLINLPQDLPAGATSSEVVSSETEVSSEETPVDNGIKLNITSPTKETTNVTEADFVFTGTADPDETLTINGETVELTNDGGFSVSVTLKVGKNTFTFEHKGESVTYVVNYRYVIMNYFSPEKAQIYSSGSTFSVAVYARTGSTVTASFNGENINLISSPAEDDDENDFIAFTGAFTLPNDNYTTLI